MRINNVNLIQSLGIMFLSVINYPPQPTADAACNDCTMPHRVCRDCWQCQVHCRCGCAAALLDETRRVGRADRAAVCE